MKLKILFLTAMCFVIFSCEVKDALDALDELEDIEMTEDEKESAIVMTAKVNGNLIEIPYKNASLFIDKVIETHRLRLIGVTETIFVIDNEAISLFAYYGAEEDLKEGVEWNLSNLESGLTGMRGIYQANDKALNNAVVNATTDDTNTAYIKINKLDYTNKVASGIFSFTAQTLVNGEIQAYVISEGTFENVKIVEQ
ncbi:hypothetical protein H7U19_12080 [Hyunsoonleella sp. SJ7]|uniref:Uncharacterized protein n=1 Tax=Hyunsoonleella aquatilis TaxID=2762758 RepID=A0A923HCX5_9FLAO|nr:hypothetical protein [Hyunsoonleella aquatilis]MBC3759149.1 hypothetical protein [Hyunsoonleella aquatilis]